MEKSNRDRKQIRPRAGQVARAFQQNAGGELGEIGTRKLALALSGGDDGNPAMLPEPARPMATAVMEAKPLRIGLLRNTMPDLFRSILHASGYAPKPPATGGNLDVTG